MTITKLPLTKAAIVEQISAEEEPLVDTTASLPLRSKRLERLQKKRHQKEAASKQHATFLDLPSELILDILSLLLPSDISNLSRITRGLQDFIIKETSRIAGTVITQRYSILTKCFPRPVLLNNVDKEAHSALLDDERQEKHLQIHKKPYQHVQSPDPQTICTCLTCMLAWNNLCLLVDFAHWQENLEHGEPIPIVPRGKNPKWNQRLISTNAATVQKALYDPLWYARILEQHLKSTVASIRRHGNNAGNKRRRFRMTNQDVVVENDAFLSRSGPPSMDFPFHRDSYYMLEAYLPNRGWNSEVNGWVYMPATQHDRDVEFVKAWAKRRREIVAEVKREMEMLS
jgi:F-box domain